MGPPAKEASGSIFGVHILAPTSSILDDLRSIAQRLRLMGCLRDCQEIYSAIRKTFFNATLTRFGIGKLSASDVQRMLLKLSGADALVKQAKQILSAMEEAPRETFLRGVHHLTTYVMDYLTRMVSGYGKCEWIVARNIDDILWIGDTFSGKTPHVHHCGDQLPLASHIKLRFSDHPKVVGNRQNPVGNRSFDHISDHFGDSEKCSSVFPTIPCSGRKYRPQK
nr:exocyst complex component EXO70A1-like [Ipomoea batatas]